MTFPFDNYPTLAERALVEVDHLITALQADPDQAGPLVEVTAARTVIAGITANQGLHHPTSAIDGLREIVEEMTAASRALDAQNAGSDEAHEVFRPLLRRFHGSIERLRD